MNKLWVCAGAVLGLYLWGGVALATSIRCGSHVIEDGGTMGQYEVLKRCGEPTAKLGWTWVYEDQNGTKRILRFGDNGQLERIDVQ